MSKATDDKQEWTPEYVRNLMRGAGADSRIAKTHNAALADDDKKRFFAFWRENGQLKQELADERKTKDNYKREAMELARLLDAERENSQYWYEQWVERGAQLAVERQRWQELYQGCKCQKCGNEFLDDTYVPDAVWELIKPKGKPVGAGLLCGTCVAERLVRCLDAERQLREQAEEDILELNAYVQQAKDKLLSALAIIEAIRNNWSTHDPGNEKLTAILKFVDLSALREHDDKIREEAEHKWDDWHKFSDAGLARHDTKVREPLVAALQKFLDNGLTADAINAANAALSKAKS